MKYKPYSLRWESGTTEGLMRCGARLFEEGQVISSQELDALQKEGIVSSYSWQSTSPTDSTPEMGFITVPGEGLYYCEVEAE